MKLGYARVSTDDQNCSIEEMFGDFCERVRHAYQGQGCGMAMPIAYTRRAIAELVVDFADQLVERGTKRNAKRDLKRLRAMLRECDYKVIFG
jgi:hypothetical protein